jgi:hypothetical protein
LTPTVRLDIRLPRDLVGRLLPMLYSPTVARIPHGELSAFFAQLLRKHFREIDEEKR